MRSTSPNLLQRIFAGCVSISKHGSSEVLDFGEYDMKAATNLQPSQVLLRHSYAGVNFIDVYYRTGLYRDNRHTLPFTPGFEGSGTILAVGSNVPDSWVGRRVAFYNCPGSYSTFGVADFQDVYPIPNGVTDKQAAAVLLQGCTANYLVEDCYKVTPESVVVVHAAAGGTGLLICQMCAMRGAQAIAICGGREKAEVAMSVGKAAFAIDYTAEPNWEEKVKSICLTLGRTGVDAVYDGVGKATFDKSCSVLRTRGAMVTFGNASGPVPPISPLQLTKYGSISLQRPKLEHFMSAENGEAKRRVSAVFDDVASQRIQVTVAKVFSLRDVRKAHDFLESKSAIGKILLDCTD